MIQKKIKEEIDCVSSMNKNSSDTNLTFHSHSKSMSEWIRSDMIGKGIDFIEGEYNITGRSCNPKIIDINKRRLLIDAANNENIETMSNSINN